MPTVLIDKNVLVPMLPQHLSNTLLAIAGCAAMLIGAAWLSRVS